MQPAPDFMHFLQRCWECVDLCSWECGPVPLPERALPATVPYTWLADLLRWPNKAQNSAAPCKGRGAGSRPCSRCTSLWGGSWIQTRGRRAHTRSAVTVGIGNRVVATASGPRRSRRAAHTAL